MSFAEGNEANAHLLRLDEQIAAMIEHNIKIIIAQITEAEAKIEITKDGKPLIVVPE